MTIYIHRYSRQKGFGVVRVVGSHKKPIGKRDEGETHVKEWRNYTWKCECNENPDIRRKLKGRVAMGGNGIEVATRKLKKCK